MSSNCSREGGDSKSSSPRDNPNHSSPSQSQSGSSIDKTPGPSYEQGLSKASTAFQSKGDESGNPSDRHRQQQTIVLDTSVQAGTALPHVDDTEQAEAAKEKPISWRELPRKDQLLFLTLARLSEPLTQTSLGSYIFYQLQSFKIGRAHV